ncbi:amino acid ABC transporter permease [Lactococcus hodotermopsidis]|uniref:Amino acid ABC transporter permease n=1 Tax=Pseudolactococcus hodotermopsidis TaxID=2709157 RepID=A0A6A0BCW8_9LACT|nr:ABC transporter substrate-binding protein/permease [Lactococcus hodotermopsidis]GFH42485.1 amino acid ABC transporter permease [Lactococcus hodotermopsidis]
MKKKFFILLTFFWSLFSAISVNADDKTIKIVSDSTYAPFEFQDSATKDYIGIDVDLMQTIADMNGWKIDQTFPGFQAALDKLGAGQADGMIAGMSINDERKKVFDFSDPYYQSAIVIATKGNTKVSSYDELKGKTVGVKNGTGSQKFLSEHEKEYGYKIKTFDEGAQMFDSLKIGDVIAVMDDAPVLEYAINQGQDLAINMTSEPVGNYGFAVKKGTHPELIAGFNKALKTLKENGGYETIIAKYTASNEKTEAIKPVKSDYKIASDSLFAPFEFQNSNKKYVGIDVDLLNAITKTQKFNVTMNFVGFQTAVDQTQAGQADGMIAGMSITDERRKVFDFSDPYFTANATIAVKDTTKDITSYKDLKGKTIGVKNGTASQEFIEKNKEKYGYKIKVFDAADTMYESLNTGSIHAFMDDEPVVKYAILQGKKFATPIEPEKIGEYGFAVKKGENPELIAMFNVGLAKLKTNGDYDKIVAKYMGDTDSDNNKVDESTMLGIIKNNWEQLAKGLGYTLSLTMISFILALIIGIIFGLFSVSPSKFLRGFTKVYVDLVRGVPLMVLAIFIFYGIPNLLESLTGHTSPLNDFAAGVIALTLNASAYIAEIVRGGVNSVPIGQMEASRSLGVSYVKTMQRVILPQAVKITIPSLVNQFIISLKDTTIISAIGLIELLQTGKIIVARNFQSFKVYGLIAIIYLIVILALTIFARRLERNMK